MNQHIIHVEQDKCIGCGLCRQDCPENNIYIADKKAIIKGQRCIKCGHCVAVCPKGAISMTGFDEPPIEFQEQTVLDARQLLQALRTRRSIRQFKTEEVSTETLQKILEAGRWTPTAKNAQDVSYIVLEKGKEMYEKTAVRFFKKIQPIVGLFVKEARNITIEEDFFFFKAPAVIMVMSKHKVNGALAASNMALMAEACGLGVLYSGFFTIAANYSGKLRRQLRLKRQDKAVMTLVLGTPDVTYHRTAQKEPARIHYV